MKRTLLVAVFATLFPARADEGMWLPVLIGERMADMQAKGCHLSADDIYSVNQACLKDAVVLFGSGCTGELVSDRGLLFTNHHCGYSYIQKHSSVTSTSFWAFASPPPTSTENALSDCQPSNIKPQSMDSSCPFLRGLSFEKPCTT